MSYSAILAIIGRISPRAWDAIVPHGPATAEAVALNPQPLPPVEALQVGAAEMAHELVRVALAAEMRGESRAALVSEVIDDWCGTHWPHWWPWPWPGPPPWGGGPEPAPYEVQAAKLAGAVVFASIGSRLADGELGATLTEGAGRLAEAAVSA